MKPEFEKSLAQVIQEVIGSSRADYHEETIIESDINQIRHLFYYLRSERLPVSLTYQLDEYTATVQGVDEGSAELSVQNFEDGPIRRCRIRFDVHGIFYEFEVALVETSKSALLIRLPFFIQSTQLREYRRIPAEDLFIRFTIDYRHFLESVEDILTVTSRYPYILNELKKEVPDLRLINRILIEEVNRISPEFELKLYGDNTGETFVQGIMAREKKAIYISNTIKIENYFARILSHSLMNFSNEYERISRETSEEEAVKFFAEMQKGDLRNFKSNYVYSPISIFEKPIGHIYVQSTLLDKRLLMFDHAYQIFILTRLFSYALNKTVFARTYLKHPLTRVVNISLGGLLFELTEKEVFYFLITNDRLKIYLHLKNDVIVFHSEISRYFPSPNGFYIGVNFLEAENDGFRILEKYLFARRRENIPLQMMAGV